MRLLDRFGYSSFLMTFCILLGSNTTSFCISIPFLLHDISPFEAASKRSVSLTKQAFLSHYSAASNLLVGFWPPRL